jgi:large subunit ribosomal protein L13
MAHYRVRQWMAFSRQWWLYDAKWQCPFQSAVVIVKYLEGRHKPIYHPLSDIGDQVVVINTKEIALEGDLWRTFKHFHHTGYPGGFSATRLYKVHDIDPTKVLYQAVYSTIKGTLLRRPRMSKLHLFPDENVPSDVISNICGQIHQVRPVPRRLDEYTKQELQNFPHLYNWPADYVISTGPKKKIKNDEQLQS